MNHNSKHSWLMTALCVLPIVLIGGMYILGITGGYLFYAILLLCPLSHVLMMKGHGQNAAPQEEET
ncbi:MAG: DUF2933 domain-containing protein [ANME-2 cluster archaeon]|nr:MAG: DUF2933 domain-containing protein [ANME-2 cluster archaeon]